jgi:hypothetical protein
LAAASLAARSASAAAAAAAASSLAFEVQEQKGFSEERMGEIKKV